MQLNAFVYFLYPFVYLCFRASKNGPDTFLAGCHKAAKPCSVCPFWVRVTAALAEVSAM